MDESDHRGESSEDDDDYVGEVAAPIEPPIDLTRYLSSWQKTDKRGRGCIGAAEAAQNLVRLSRDERCSVNGGRKCLSESVNMDGEKSPKEEGHSKKVKISLPNHTSCSSSSDFSVQQNKEDDDDYDSESVAPNEPAIDPSKSLPTWTKTDKRGRSCIGAAAAAQNLVYLSHDPRGYSRKTGNTTDEDGDSDSDELNAKDEEISENKEGEEDQENTKETPE